MATPFKKKCPYIESCEELTLTVDLASIKNPARQHKLRQVLNKTSTFRIIYTIRKDFRVTGFLSVPTHGRSLPCIIHLRGGSRDFGALSNTHLITKLAWYASQGFVVITTQYPGVDGGDGQDTQGGPDDIASIKKLRNILEYVRKANTKRIGVKGHSRGGLMTYMLLREVSWIKAAVIGGAPTDEIRSGKERKGWRKHQIGLYGKNREELVKRSPILWAKELPKNAPLLIVHGSADWRVRADHGILMSQELYKHKVPHKFILFEGADHGISEFAREYRDLTLEWFKRFLDKKRLLPNLKPHGV